MYKPSSRQVVLISLTTLFLASSAFAVMQHQEQQALIEDRNAIDQFEKYVNSNIIYPVDLDEKTTVIYIRATGYEIHYRIEVDDWYDKVAADEFHDTGFGMRDTKHLCRFNLPDKPVVVTYTLIFLGGNKEVTYKDKLIEKCSKMT